MPKTKIAIIGSGNIGTDLMYKISRLSDDLEVAVLVGIDPSSDGLARARQLGISTTHRGVDGLIDHPDFAAIPIIFEATSADTHRANAERLTPYGKQLIDLTPAALGPFVVPVVNLDGHIDAPDINMVTCGGQATVPVVAAVSRVTDVYYAEIIATIASKSAGIGTRDNIDEFTGTTAKALEVVGGARRGKAIIILNPAEPPMIMRDTVHLIVSGSSDRNQIVASVQRQTALVAEYVPGYRLKQPVQFLDLGDAERVRAFAGGPVGALLQVSVFLEVEGAAQYLPAYAGNLDIMTAAAVRAASVAARRMAAVAA